MGGKQKQAQRVKNNARPSSSSRSAEFLNSSTTHQFTGFSTIKESGFATPTFSLPSTNDFDASLDANFQLVLKKMNKKDSTTKLKALQEFSCLVKQSEVEAIKAILPFWPRLYCTLVTDTNHKVREAAHVAHNEVVFKVKRNIAPYLKQLAGAWFTSQYDTYPPAASAACKAFNDAFPKGKVKEVLVFCQGEILNYIHDNLIVHTPQTLSNPKHFSPEECKAKYERLLVASLQGYSLYVEEVDKIENLDLNLKIVSSSKFWKLAHYDDSQIRASFYALLANLCEKAPVLLKDSESSAVKAVFSHLDEKDSLVQVNIWQSALLIVDKFTDCFKYINFNEKVLPKLWIVLREAAYGNAAVIYPNLLPLLSRFLLNADISIEDLSFKFFDHIRQGLRQNSVRTSSLESRAISTAFVECLQYIVKENHSKESFCCSLITNELIPFLESYLIDSKAAHKTLFLNVATFLKHLYNKKTDYENYARFIELFWTQCETLLKDQLSSLINEENRVEIVEQTAARHVELIIALKHSSKAKNKVQFVKEENAKKEEAERKSSSVVGQMNSESYQKDLKEFAYKICVHFLKRANETRKIPGLLDNAYGLLQEFEDPCVIDFIKSNLFDQSQYENGVEMGEIFDLIFGFIQEKSLCSKATFNLLFFMLKFSDEGTKAQALEKLLKETLNDETFVICANIALSYPYNLDQTVQDWISNHKIETYFIKIMVNEVEGTSTPASTLLLKQVFTETRNGDLFISKLCVQRMLDVLTACLHAPLEHPKTIDTCASLASYISTIIYAESKVHDFGHDLFYALLIFDCQMSGSDHEFLTKDTLWEANACWQDAFGVITLESSVESFNSLLNVCLKIFENHVFKNKSFNHLKIVDFLLVIEKSRPLLVSDFLNSLHRNQFALNFEPILHQLTDVCLHFNGSLCYYERIEAIDALNFDNDSVRYFAWKLLVLNVLKSSIPSCEDYYDDEAEANKANFIECKYVLNFLENENDVVFELLKDLTILGVLEDNLTQTPFYENLCEIKNTFVEAFNELLKVSDINKTSLSESKKPYDDYFLEKIVKNNPFWCVVAHNFYVNVKKERSIEVYKRFSSLLLNFESQRMNFTRVFAEDRQISYDEVQRGLGTLESIVTLRSLASYCEDIEVQIAQVFKRIENLRDETFKSAFYNIDLGNWNQIQCINEILELFSVLIQNVNKNRELSRRQWDLILVSLGSWSAKLERAVVNDAWKQLHVSKFIISLSALYVSIVNYVKELDDDQVQEKTSFIDEWENVFNKSITRDLTLLWMHISELGAKSSSNPHLILFQKFGKIIEHLQPTYIFDSSIDSMPKWPKVLKQCCTLLVSPINCFQLWGYHMLRLLSPCLVNVDCISVNTNTPHEKGLIFEQFKSLLTGTHTVISTMLLDIKLGESSCRVQPFTDSYVYTMAYLLLWDILIQLCEFSSTEVRFQYSDWLKKEDLLNSLIGSLFKLMPIEVFQSKTLSTLTQWFSEKPALKFHEPINSEKIERLACSVYFATLSQLPANVRHWWTNAESRISQMMERVTSLYVSPQLCLRELQDLSKYENKFKNMMVKVHPSVREVVAIYTVDETQMELVITLPVNYPLGGPNVQCNRLIGGLAHKQWLMQLRMCLLHQNGRIWDALSLWNQNLEKKFDGVEECYICFAVLHPGTYQIPKLSCRTCRKKFHAACLYKWFNTSSKSTCPICRNLF